MPPSKSSSPRKIGLVLPAGGARAAYQVGVFRYIGENFPEFTPKIFTGVSAGSINACFLAQGDPFPKATRDMYQLWETLQFNQVLQTNFRSMFGIAARSLYDLILSKVTKRLLMKSLLDASPLAHTLLTHIHFWKVSRAIRAGTVEGLAVSATNYHDGSTTIFYDSTHSIKPWVREQRRALRTSIRVRHVMASCSIPVLFEPVRIGDFLYGDGSLRFSFPFSPAIKLGATHLFAVGIRCPHPENSLGFRPDHVGIGFVLGAVLNSIFMDSLESDYENLGRINADPGGSSLRRLPALLIRPSQDLGSIAKEHLDEVPFHLRQVLKSTADREELGDLLSYLMFSPGFLSTLLRLGMKDAEAAHDKIAQFLEAEHYQLASTKA